MKDSNTESFNEEDDKTLNNFAEALDQKPVEVRKPIGDDEVNIAGRWDEILERTSISRESGAPKYKPGETNPNDQSRGR